MEWFHSFSADLTRLSPALYPMLGVAYSLISNLHCGVMCSTFLPKHKKNQYQYGRLISYTTMGLIFGAIGEALKISLEYKLLSFVAFFFFTFFTMGLLFSKFFSVRIHFKPKLGIQVPFLRGLLSAFIPCHLLFFFYSFAALSSSWWVGAFILFSHALITMPSLNFGEKYITNFFGHLRFGKPVIKLLIVIICFFNLIHFASQWSFQDVASDTQIICN